MTKPANATELLGDLIRCPSVTPEEGGALDYLESWLSTRGFTVTRLPYGQDGEAPSDNLYARRGTGGQHFCFAGHTDVVPPGDAGDWQEEPFSGAIRDGALWGRGAVDMKGGIACFMAAVDRLLHENPSFDQSLSLLITGDEEGPAINGTAKVVDWMAANDELPTVCLVGEPTNPEALSDMVKIGRRGSMTSRVEVIGVQGHSAYPHLAKNPVHALIDFAHTLTNTALDEGTEHFPPSNLAVVSFDVGNPANNVIPAKASAMINIRFNDAHSSDSLVKRLEQLAGKIGQNHGVEVTLSHQLSGESFVFDPDSFATLIADSVEARLGKRPAFSTTGGTSDARFIKALCPVAEYGLVGRTMHQVDERVALKDLDQLTEIYHDILRRFFRT